MVRQATRVLRKIGNGAHQFGDHRRVVRRQQRPPPLAPVRQAGLPSNPKAKTLDIDLWTVYDNTYGCGTVLGSAVSDVQNLDSEALRQLDSAVRGVADLMLKVAIDLQSAGHQVRADTFRHSRLMLLSQMDQLIAPDRKGIIGHA